jgi:hypothetical protein
LDGWDGIILNDSFFSSVVIRIVDKDSIVVGTVVV